MSQPNVNGESPMDGVISRGNSNISQEELRRIVDEYDGHRFADGEKCFVVPKQFWDFVVSAADTGDINKVPEISCASISLKDAKEGISLTPGRRSPDVQALSESVFHRLRDAFGVQVDHLGVIEHRVVVTGDDIALKPLGTENSGLTREELGELIKTAEDHPLNVGEKWYIVPKQWWASVYTAYKQGYPEDILPINCSKISTETLEGYFLKPDLKESIDFYFLPQSVFERLRAARGLVNPSRDVIEREVVLKKKQPTLHTYPRVVTVSLARDVSTCCRMTLTGEESMADIRDYILSSLYLVDVPMSQLRFYITTGDSSDSWELIDPTQNNVDAYFDTAQRVCLDVFDNKEGWFIHSQPKSSQPSSSTSLFGPRSSAAWWYLVYRAVCMITNWRWLLSATTTLLFRLQSFNYRSYGTIKESPALMAIHTPGVCGLHNLGNTCFMASAVQCLSNVPSLTEFFLAEEYKKDLNAVNPLGTHGELALAYAEIIRLLWSGEHTALHPRKLKATIGQFAPRFSGYAQQDSQELLAYLLDGLHEDLNRIKKKPYVEEDEHYDRLEEHKKAELSWQAYKARNDSIIVDKFHGQLKSKLVCPTCNKVSIKFDPFCFLSVPLPPKDRLPKLSVTVIYSVSPKKKWAKFTLTLSASTPAMNVTKFIKNELKSIVDDSYDLVLFSVGINHDDVRLLDPMAPAISEDKPHELYAAQVENVPLLDRKYVIVKNQSSTGRPLSLPMVFATKKGEKVSEKVEKILRFTSENYISRDKEFGEDSYKIMVNDGNNFTPFSEDLKTDDFSSITLVFQWKDNNIFNSYKGTDLIERECTLNSKKDIHLKDCIDIFTREEQLGEDDSWYCPKCKEHVRATKKLDLWNLPEILIIHLKRFHYSRWNRDKIDIPVILPVRGFELNDRLANDKHEHVKYDLIAMSHHAGGLGGGHYTASALNKDTGKWYEYNDSSAFEGSAPNDPLTARTPYLLVYQRRSVTPDGAHADSNFEMETD